MHRTYLKEVHPGLYERLILNATLHTHLADANERAEAMMELLTEQIKKQEGITEQLKVDFLLFMRNPFFVSHSCIQWKNA